MMNNIFKKSNWMVLLPAGILFALLAASPVFADYSGHVASFKSEKNAVAFIHKMKAKGLVAYYQKEDVPGKGEFYRTYIGGYKTLPLAQKALTKLKKSGDIDFFKIFKMAEKSGEVETKKTSAVAQKSEPAQKPESKIEPVAQKNEPAQKPESTTEIAAQKNALVQKPENKIESAEQKSEPIQKPESKAETVAPKSEPVQKPESKTKLAEKKSEPVQKSEKKTAPSINTRHYYDGIKGIVLKNGKIIKGQIISVDDNDVLKIRIRSGRILSYSFTKDVKEYITGYEP
jgi:hypothetical protein